MDETDRVDGAAFLRRLDELVAGFADAMMPDGLGARVSAELFEVRSEANRVLFELEALRRENAKLREPFDAAGEGDSVRVVYAHDGLAVWWTAPQAGGLAFSTTRSPDVWSMDALFDSIHYPDAKFRLSPRDRDVIEAAWVNFLRLRADGPR